MYAQPQDKICAQFGDRVLTQQRWGTQAGVLIRTGDSTPASGASLVVMVDSSNLDGGVVLPIVESDSQPDSSGEVQPGRQLQVHISDSPTVTSAI